MTAVEPQTEFVTAHTDLHSEQGAVRGDRPSRARNPVIKVEGLAWLEFEKPDLDRAELFARDFGLTVHARAADALYLRGTLPGTQCAVIRRGPHSRFVGAAFQAADARDLNRFARATGASIQDLGEPGGGQAVTVTDPSGLRVRVVPSVEQLPALAGQQPLTLNTGRRHSRTNLTQRPAREPARVERLGHVALASRVFGAALDWHLQNLGLIVSDFLFLDGQRDRGPTMAFIRCDRGTEPSDHHTLAMLLAPETGYVHSAFQVADLDALAAGGQYLADRGYTRSWGIGRHVQGSQIFDYWRDPERLMVEHYTDGDRFDDTLEPGWAPMSASGLAQWGPPATRDFLGTTPTPTLIRTAVNALREDNEIDLSRLKGLMKAMSR